MLLRSARLSFGIKSSITSSSAGRFLSTIYALSSGHGKCGVSVIRVSGPNSAKAITSLTGRLKPPEARRATFTKIYDPETGIVLDHSLAIWFPGPASFTGEDICEFQVHGSPAVVRAVLKALAKVPGLRAAEIGEFTRRAFSAGKLDLTQVEGLSDLIHSETEQQRKQALRQMEGGLSKQFEVWRNQLVKIVANVEAFIDFAESEEIEEDILQQVRESVSKLDVEFTRHLAAAEAGERLREGVHLAIVGEPNVGKSSLLNYLVQRDAAIVSHIPGTTRDVIETRLDLAGYPVNICDTAGLREDTSDPVEKEGMTRALLHAKQADLVLRVQDVTTHEAKGLSNEIIIESERTLNIVNKIDLLDDPGSLEMRPDHIYVSVKTGAGLEELTSKLIAEIELLCQTNSIGECPSITRQRHREHLKRASIHLQEYLTQESSGNDIVIVAQQLRKAIREIGFVTGKISSEKILDVIFSDFCIGK